MFGLYLLFFSSLTLSFWLKLACFAVHMPSLPRDPFALSMWDINQCSGRVYQSVSSLRDPTFDHYGLFNFPFLMLLPAPAALALPPPPLSRSALQKNTRHLQQKLVFWEGLISLQFNAFSGTDILQEMWYLCEFWVDLGLTSK